MSAVSLILPAMVVGTVATAFMDLIALAQRRLRGAPSLDYALVGRWLGHMPRGRLIHPAIARSDRIAREAVIGWGAHYLIGMVFAGVLLALAGPGWRQQPGPLWPLAFGAATVAMPFLVLQPCVGAGAFARKTAAPWTARRRSLLAHITFGVGLWLGALCWAGLAPMR